MHHWSGPASIQGHIQASIHVAIYIYIYIYVNSNIDCYMCAGLYMVTETQSGFFIWGFRDFPYFPGFSRENPPGQTHVTFSLFALLFSCSLSLFLPLPVPPSLSRSFWSLHPPLTHIRFPPEKRDSLREKLLFYLYILTCAARARLAFLIAGTKMHKP